MIKYWKEDINIEMFGNVEMEDALKIAEQYRTELQKVYPAADIVINVNEDKRIDFSSDSEPYFDNDVVTAWENALSGVVQ